MAPAQFKVIIAGGGIAGLSLGVMLERAGIDYLILEAGGEIQPLGAVVYLGAPVLRAFEQLGLLEDLIRHSNFMTGVTLMDHKLNKICRIDVAYAKERYGYDTLTIFRPKLYNVLLSRIPAYKILFSKRVTSTVQSSEGIKVQCEDGSTYNGDILVAADGGASPIRKAMYTEIKKRTKKGFHPQDYALPKLDQRCIVGVTEPLSVKQYPVLASKDCELMLVMPRDTNCMVWWIPMEGRRFGWGVTSPMPSTTHPSSTKKKKEESKSNGQNHLRETTTNTTSSSSFDMPHSPSSTHGGAGAGHRQFSSLSGTSYSPPSSNSSSSIHGGYGSNIQTYNNGGSDNGVSSSSNITTSATAAGANNNLSLKKRQSFGRLSKISTSSSSNGSQTNFQKYPPVLVSASSNMLTPPLELKDLPNDRTWSTLDTQYGIDESIREQASPFGGTFGDIIDLTSRKMMTMCVVEEKFYHTWHFGRTILLGDSCHKLLPSSGHGTTQAVLDSISLASLLYDLPSNSATDIEALFRIQFERRGPTAKAAVTASQQQDQLLFNRNLSGKFIRKMASNFVSDKIKIKLGDRLFDARPVLPFLTQVPSRGHAKNTDKTDVPLTQDKRFELARRKSISSGYLTSGDSGSGGYGSRRGSFDYGSSGERDRREFPSQGNGRSLDMTFETPSYPYSTSMPSVILPGGTMLPNMPMTRPMSSMMDVEGTLIPMLSRPPEKHPYRHHQEKNPGHWNLYQ